MRFRQHERTAQLSTLRLLSLFGLVLIGLLLAVNGVLALIYWLTIPYARGYPNLFFETNCALVLLFVLGGCWVETVRLREGGAHVARMAGGREVQLSAGGELGLLERRFANTVQEMAIAAGHGGVPAAWVLPRDDAINAFAAGWDDGDALIAVTRGALERLTRAELQGVVAHEFSHLRHGDTRLNMRLIGLVWGLQMIWGLGVSLWEPDSEGRRGAGTLFGLGLMAVGSLGWAAGRLLQAAVSRQREFLADASAVKYTRVVDGLGGALRKIADQQMHNRSALQSNASSMAHLLLSNRGAGGGWRALWHTHPTLAERLHRLYGHEVLPLAAQVLAVDLDAAEPLMRLAPSATGRADSADVSASPESERHDALQNPASFDAAAREQEALARIGRWHGPGEWQAGMLALAIDAEAPDRELAWAAWQAATADLGVAATVRLETEALGANARRQVFTLLVQRARSTAAAPCRALRSALMKRWAALPPTPALRWRALALSLLLGVRMRRARPAHAGLAQHAEAAHAATGLLASSLGAEPEACQRWHNAAVQALMAMDVAPPRGPAAGLAPATLAHSLQLALRLRRLSPMQRPLLLRAWLVAATQSGLQHHAGCGDALHLACLLLDVPVPETLAG